MRCGGEQLNVAAALALLMSEIPGELGAARAGGVNVLSEHVVDGGRLMT